MSHTSMTNNSVLSKDSSAENSLGSISHSDSNDINEFFSFRAKCAGNLLVGFLNINSLRNKITDLRMIAERKMFA